MSRLLRYSCFALLWCAVAGYVIYAGTAARRVRGAKRIQRLDIEVVDSSSQGHLVSARQVRGWIANHGIETVGKEIDGVDLTAIEQLIARNGFVEHVAAYVSYAGVLHVSISQRKPIVRLLTDGRNSYVTERGYVFDAPRASSLYVPVVTGPYRPPFPADHVGSVRDHIDRQLEELEGRIDELEREKYPFYRRELKNDRNLAELRRMRIRQRWWRLETDSMFRKRVDDLRAEKARLRRAYRYEARLIREGIEQIERRQEAVRQQQKKLEKSYEDFMKLLTFVGWVEEDAFWRSEIVQISARTTSSGALEVDLTPRSGRHLIRFGRLERIGEKFDKLLRFYRNGLSSFGWDTYGVIDIRFGDQVVCRK